MKLLSKREAELKDLENSQPIHMEKNETTMGMFKLLLDRKINVDQPSQQKSELFSKTIEEWLGRQLREPQDCRSGIDLEYKGL